MKFLIFFALLAIAFATKLQGSAEFTAFMQKYGKTYSNDEFKFRYQTFMKNKDYVERNNRQHNGMTLGINKFADLTNVEFKKLYLMKSINVQYEKVHERPIDIKLPTEFNWTSQGAVTPVKDQGQCGSCWSFSTTGSVEGCHFQRTGELVGLSEQNLVDCSDTPEYQNEGCNGGLMTEAMWYIINNKGIDTEASYPYTAETGTTCLFTKTNVGATLESMINVTSGDEVDLLSKVAVGPVSVAIDASHTSFQLYESGVYYEPQCSSTQLDHGVLAVGWGVDGHKDYWVVKNSWNTGWGMNGYIWMSRNVNNNCGIATMATLPVCPPKSKINHH